METGKGAGVELPLWWDQAVREGQKLAFLHASWCQCLFLWRVALHGRAHILGKPSGHSAVWALVMSHRVPWSPLMNIARSGKLTVFKRNHALCKNREQFLTGGGTGCSQTHVWFLCAVLPCCVSPGPAGLWWDQQLHFLWARLRRIGCFWNKNAWRTFEAMAYLCVYVCLHTRTWHRR